MAPPRLKNSRHKAHVLILARRYDDAVKEGQLIHSLMPTYVPGYWPLVQAHGARREWDAVVDLAQQGLEQAEDDAGLQMWLGLALLNSGKSQEADDLMARALKRRHDGHFSAVLIGVLYIEKGDTDLAMDWLSRAQDERDSLCTSFAAHFLYDPLRSDPRFQALLRKMNFPTA